MSTIDEIARLQAQVADLLAAVKAVRARHVLRNITGGHCAACHRPWPCPTLGDLDGLGLGAPAGELGHTTRRGGPRFGAGGMHQRRGPATRSRRSAPGVGGMTRQLALRLSPLVAFYQVDVAEADGARGPWAYRYPEPVLAA